MTWHILKRSKPGQERRVSSFMAARKRQAGHGCPTRPCSRGEPQDGQVGDSFMADCGIAPLPIISTDVDTGFLDQLPSSGYGVRMRIHTGVSRNAFQKVTVFDSPASVAGKAAVAIFPKSERPLAGL